MADEQVLGTREKRISAGLSWYAASRPCSRLFALTVVPACKSGERVEGTLHCLGGFRGRPRTSRCFVSRCSCELSLPPETVSKLMLRASTWVRQLGRLGEDETES